MSIIIGAGGASAGAPGAADGDLIKDATDASFEADVLIASQTAPVVVDFWAPWCGPCKQLTPALEAAVKAQNGKVKLVKINIDENPMMAGQMRVQSIPAVFAFAGGRPVDGFMGALPASEINRFMERLAGQAPGAEEVSALLERAEAALETGDAGGAAQDFAAVLQLEPENARAMAGLARCYLVNGDADRARDIVAMIPEDAAKDPAVESIRAALALADEAGGDVAGLVAKVEGAPSDHDARFDLAKALAARGDFRGARDHLLTILKMDAEWNDGAAKAELLTVFEAAGPASPVTVEGRKALSTLLFA